MIEKTGTIHEFEKAFHIAHNEKYFCCVGNCAHLYDRKSGKHINKLEDMKQPSFSCFTSDGRLIIKTAIGEYYVYDLANFKLNKILLPPKGISGSVSEFLITPDNRYIIDFAYFFPSNKLMVLEIGTGKIKLYDLGNAKVGKLFLDDNKVKGYVLTNLGPTDKNSPNCCFDLYSFELPFDELVLKKICPPKLQQAENEAFHFGKIAYKGKDKSIWVYNINNHQQKKLFYVGDSVLYDLSWSKNGKYLVLAESQKVSIFDVSKRSCVKSYDANHACFAEFFENDSKLLVGTWKKGYCLAL